MKAALEAEQEVRLVEGAMHERAGRLAAVEAESLQRTGSAAAMLGRSPSRVMLQPQQQSFRGGESGRVSPTPRPEVLALVKMLPSTAFRMCVGVLQCCARALLLSAAAFISLTHLAPPLTRPHTLTHARTHSPCALLQAAEQGRADRQRRGAADRGAH